MKGLQVHATGAVPPRAGTLMPLRTPSYSDADDEPNSYILQVEHLNKVYKKYLVGMELGGNGRCNDRNADVGIHPHEAAMLHFKI